MIVAGRILPYKYMLFVVHIILSVTSGLSMCRTIVGHFKDSPENTAELNVQQSSHGQEEESLAQNVPMHWNSTLNKVGETQQRPTEGNTGAAEAQVNHANLSWKGQAGKEVIHSVGLVCL